MSAEFVFSFHENGEAADVASISSVVSPGFESLDIHSKHVRFADTMQAQTTQIEPELAFEAEESVSDDGDSKEEHTPTHAKTVKQAIVELGLTDAINGPAKETMCAVSPDAFIVHEKRVYINAAKAVCKNCLSLIQCRESNINNPEPMIYGGLTDAERKSIQSRTRRSFKI